MRCGSYRLHIWRGRGQNRHAGINDSSMCVTEEERQATDQGWVSRQMGIRSFVQSETVPS